jgi:phage terminase large subunit GpA-like protein
MKYCTFCSRKNEILFNHPIYDIGSLCIECYMRFHTCCGVCDERYILSEMQEDVTYRIKAKFIGMGEKSIILCDYCYDAIQREFPEQMV